MVAGVRAQWKGTLQVGSLAIPVALFTAASTAERTTFNMINRATGNRLRREFVDPTTDMVVPKENQAKGFEVDHGQFLVFDDGELEAAIPQSDKKLAIKAFISKDEVDTQFFDKPRQSAALAHAVLFRRYRAVLIMPLDMGMIGYTLSFDYEVRSAAAAFEGLADVEIKDEMLDLAKHIITSKMGQFDPSSFTDRYEAAVADLVRAKIEGRKIVIPKAQAATNVVNLLDALRASAGMKQAKAVPRKKAEPSRKAS